MFEVRMRGGKFSASTNNSTYNDVYTIASDPPA